MFERNGHLGQVLLVDDDQELRFILRAHLMAGGFEVLEAGDGRQGHELAAEKQPDLIVMDVGLPGLDGVAATRLIKSDVRTESIPVIMLTARSNTSDLVRGLEAGAQEYLVKPFDVTEFMARVRTVYRLAVARKDLDRLNARLEAEVDEKTLRLQVLYEFMRDLNHAKTRDRILDLLKKAIVDITGATRISIFLKDDVGENLVCLRALGMDSDQVRPIRVDAVGGIAGQVFRRGTTVAARALNLGPATDRDYQREAFLCTPLVSTSLETQDGSIGVINMTNKAEDAPFSTEEIECIRSVADAAAIALDNIVRRGRLQQSVRVLLQTLGHLAEYRDEETTEHLGRVTQMARVLADELRQGGEYPGLVTDEFIDNLVQAAPMHDIGKVGIPDEILTKPGKLTDEEFQIMKSHTDIGRRVLSRAVDPRCPNPLLQMCIDIAWCHHERFDGTGYPRRIRGSDIPLAARIIALVDAYDAMTSSRCYKPARSHEMAVGVVQAESGKHFDPLVVRAFLRAEAKFDELRASITESATADLAGSLG